MTLDNFMNYLAANAWVLKIVFYILLGVVASWIEGAIHNRLLPKFKDSKRLWDHAFVEAVHKPFNVFLWLIIFTLILPVVITAMGFTNVISLDHISKFREVLFLIALLWFAMRFISGVEEGVVQHGKAGRREIKDRTSVRAVGQLLRVVVIVVALLVFMQTVGVKIATFLAVGGIGGVAIAFAAKDVLANFLGGMMIFWDRPFSVGDWIRSPDRNIEGTVEKIGWRLTTVRTFDKRPLYVPNSTFSTIALENPSRMHNRRIKTTIGLRYDDANKVAGLLQEIEKMLREHQDIDTTQTIMVNLFEFASSSLNFFVYCFTKTTDWVTFQAVQQDVFLKILNIIEAHGAECAFPTSTLHIQGDLK